MVDKRSKKELRSIIEQQAKDLVEYDKTINRLQDRIDVLSERPREYIKRVIVEHAVPPLPTEGYGEILNEHGAPIHRFGVAIRPAVDTFLDIPYLPGNDLQGPTKYQLRIRWQR